MFKINIINKTNIIFFSYFKQNIISIFMFIYYNFGFILIFKQRKWKFKIEVKSNFFFSISIITYYQDCFNEIYQDNY